MIQKIRTSLWFDSNAEEAVKFYTSIFKNSSIDYILYYTEVGQEHHQMPVGSVMAIDFTLDSVKFNAINGGPIFSFNQAISLIVQCDTQEEIDYFWETLIANGGEEQPCGWLKDKFGVPWQIEPKIFYEFSQKEAPEKFNRMLQSMFQMRKLDIAELKRAYNG